MKDICIAVFDTPVEWDTEPTKSELDIIDKIYMGMAKATMRRVMNIYNATAEDVEFEQTPAYFIRDIYQNGYVIMPKIKVLIDEKFVEKFKNN